MGLKSISALTATGRWKLMMKIQYQKQSDHHVISWKDFRINANDFALNIGEVRHTFNVTEEKANHIKSRVAYYHGLLLFGKFAGSSWEKEVKPMSSLRLWIQKNQE